MSRNVAEALTQHFQSMLDKEGYNRGRFHGMQMPIRPLLFSKLKAVATF